MWPLSKRMPSVSSSSRPKVLLSSTVMTPSLPTLSIASEMISPTVVSAARDRRGRGDLLLGLDVLGALVSASETALDGPLDAALERHRVGAGGDVAQTLAHQRLGQHGGGGGAVTRDVVGLLGDLLDQLGADLLPGVLELDLLGDGHAVVGDRGSAPLLVQHDVAALGAERHLYGVGELVHAALEAATSLLVERDHLGHAVMSSIIWTLASAERCPRRTVPVSGGGPHRPDLALIIRECQRRVWHSHPSSASRPGRPRPGPASSGGLAVDRRRG